jgi:hypothetical protein
LTLERVVGTGEAAGRRTVRGLDVAIVRMLECEANMQRGDGTSECSLAPRGADRSSGILLNRVGCWQGKRTVSVCQGGCRFAGWMSCGLVAAGRVRDVDAKPTVLLVSLW